MSKNQNNEVKEEPKESVQMDAECENTGQATADAQVEADAKVEEPQTEELDPVAELEKQLQEQALALDEWKNKFLYLSAEFDNYRKRTLKEKAELILNGGEKAIAAVLPVLDDLERILQNAKADQPVETVIEGVGLVYDKFLKSLQQQGVKIIETKDQELNTDYHEAIAVVPAGEDNKNKIIDTVQNGYTLNDKVIRHARVVVGN